MRLASNAAAAANRPPISLLLKVKAHLNTLATGEPGIGSEKEIYSMKSTITNAANKYQLMFLDNNNPSLSSWL